VALDDRSQKTEQPTPRRLQKAREKGQVARSSEIPAVFGLLGLLVFAQAFGRDWIAALQELLAHSFGRLALPDLTVSTARSLLDATTWAFGGLLIAPLGLLTAAGVAGHLVQGPPPISAEPLKPSLKRMNPASNLGRIFSLKQLVEVLKVVVKLTLYVTVTVLAAREALLAPEAGAPGAAGTLALLLGMARDVIVRVALLGALLAGLDWLFRRFDHVRSLRMSKNEIREERKETEGDPLVRARIRSRQMALARVRMMAEVPKATVVVTNPTHYAVALRYEPGASDVPTVVAKGRDLIAARIRALAEEHGVPIVSDPPLARALYKSVPLGGEIRPALFRAVAEVLALVMRPRRAAGGVRP
jgi:flagellar biosynthetic protein FlhB